MIYIIGVYEMYYVYQIINKINGKFYIGKRKHLDPYNDKYMGSGKQIKHAIIKYGMENFSKHILSIFDTNEAAAELEAKLVTKELIESGLTYNMHEGGHGGFHHINDGSPEHIIRASRGGKNNKTKWNNIRPFVKGDTRTLSASKKGNAVRSVHGLTLEHKAHIKEARNNNSELYKNKCWIENVDGQRKFVDIEDSIVYIHDGWIRCADKVIKPTLWISDPLTEKQTIIKRDCLQSYLDLGWVEGKKFRR